MMDRFLYDKEAAAVALSTTTRRIDDLRRSGQLEAVQDGREHKFTRDALQDYTNRLIEKARRSA